MKRGLLLTAVVAVVLALGIALGAGPLQYSRERQAQEVDRLTDEVKALEGQVAGQHAASVFAEEFATAVAPSVIGGVLPNRPVAILALPGAESATVDQLGELVGMAGGRVSGVVALSDQAARSEGRQLLEELTSQMLVSTGSAVTVDADATGYQRFGVLLGRMLGTSDAAGADYDEVATSVTAAFEAAEVIKVSEPIEQRAGVVLVVAGPPGKDENAAAQNQVPLAILSAMTGQVPVVVTGSRASAGEHGLIGAIRADGTAAGRLSTVDGSETGVGRLVTIRVTAARLGGTIGHYGDDAPDGVLPGR